MKKLGLLAVFFLLTGCGFKTGLVNRPPAVTDPLSPARVTVYRPVSLVGIPVPMTFMIDGVETYGLWIGQSYSFRLDAGDYIFGFYLGVNECRQFIRLIPKRSHSIRLGPECHIKMER